MNNPLFLLCSKFGKMTFYESINFKLSGIRRNFCSGDMKSFIKMFRPDFSEINQYGKKDTVYD
jgi:hypothetical protein